MGGPDEEVGNYDQAQNPGLVNERGFQAGFATLLIALLLTVLSLYGMESYVKANGEKRIAKRETQSRQAVYRGESGVEWAKWQLTVNPDFREGGVDIAGGLVRVTAAPSEGGYWVTSIAEAGTAKRKIGVLLQQESGKWKIVRYQELHQ